MAFSSGYHEDHRPAVPLAPKVNLRGKAAAAAAKGLSCRSPFGTGGVLVRPDDGAVDEVQRPVQPAFGVGPPLQFGQDPIPHSRLLPAVEAAGTVFQEP